jgi:hypothetical protein
MEYLVGRGYGASDAAGSFSGVSLSQYECIKGLVERGYGASDARRNCVN